jgi:hypothetical protein
MRHLGKYWNMMILTQTELKERNWMLGFLEPPNSGKTHLVQGIGRLEQCIRVMHHLLSQVALFHLARFVKRLSLPMSSHMIICYKNGMLWRYFKIFLPYVLSSSPELCAYMYKQIDATFIDMYMNKQI